jgi:hypothetical protein
MDLIYPNSRSAIQLSKKHISLYTRSIHLPNYKSKISSPILLRKYFERKKHYTSTNKTEKETQKRKECT